MFNALTSMGVDVGVAPFTTTGSNIGTAQVPDGRLEHLAQLSDSAKVVPAGLHVVDIAGLVSGASGGEGLGNQFLAQIREADALSFVLRAFDDPAVTYATEPSDPAADLEVLETELCLTDLESIETRLPKAQKKAESEKSGTAEVAAMSAAAEVLGDGVPLYRSALSAEQRMALRDQFLLTDKLVLYLVNIGEDQISEADEIEAALRKVVGEDATVATLCGALEAEIAELDDAGERADLLGSYGLAEPAIGRVARAAYQALGKRTFLTTGEKESRAWTIPAGATAKQAAGVIHSDFERGFIRAEIASYDEVVAAGGWDEARKCGTARLEGKDYVVADGDVVEFRFNV